MRLYWDPTSGALDCEICPHYLTTNFWLLLRVEDTEFAKQ